MNIGGRWIPFPRLVKNHACRYLGYVVKVTLRARAALVSYAKCQD
jgi:hypothetical protein